MKRNIKNKCSKFEAEVNNNTSDLRLRVQHDTSKIVLNGDVDDDDDDDGVNNDEIRRGQEEEEEVEVEQQQQEQQTNNFNDFPLVQTMIQYEKIRNGSFRCNSYTQFEYPKSNDGWMKTIFIVRGRALDQILLPYTFVTLHTIIVTMALQWNWVPHLLVQNTITANNNDWTFLYGNVFNFTISFMLVFRLNRSAARYWESRQFWGVLIATGRTFISGILIHGKHNPIVRDNTIRWMAAGVVATMVYMQGGHNIPNHSLDGILDIESIEQLESVSHPPIYASDRTRRYLKQLFTVTADTPLSLSHAWTVQMDRLEEQLNTFMNQFGAMERIRGTPLPIAHVSHLRTFLLIHLLLFPYVFGPEHGWGTIPISMLTSFAFLGIEAASSEVENPFSKDQVNNLNMDALAMALLKNIQQQITTDAELTMEVGESYSVIEV